MPLDKSFVDGLLEDVAFRAGAAQGLMRSADAPDKQSEFFENVRNTLLRSLEIDVEEVWAPALFVLAETPRVTAGKYGQPTKLQDLDLQSPQQWSGKLVFAAQHGSNGWAVPIPEGSVAGAVNALISGGDGHHPAVTFYPEKRVLGCSATGVGSEEKTLRLSLPKASRQVTLNDLREVMELVRQEGLLIPDICPPQVWQKPNGYVPGPETERVLQWCLAAEMRGYFRPILIQREQAVNVGRIDILFTDPTAQPNARHPAVVEVKVLRSFGSTELPISPSTNLYSLVKGMGQAKAYRRVKKAKLGALAVFDLRKIKTDLLASAFVQKAADRFYDEQMETIMLPMYGVVEHAQAEMAAN
ncbi:hypothetical protein FJ951_17540 [Mesorhizobium sp. B2-2-3]|uniref:hypothetical protein n=1 Tax=Mesorhizobium sp. B2-2-3 TaxID=2589963 RepID=UPI00112B9A11|nr:hypothetical protein [Mesorhizobium sp. B2-2-3]TPM45633.1 hypothetical protein FJ951_17540 [Mesorhizobium sp. B2-2-3]